MHSTSWQVTSETTSDGVSERLFTLGDITGVFWSPADAVGGRPLVLLGHGGGGHKKAPGLVARARRYVAGCGFAVAPIDASGFGDRPKPARDEQFIAGVRARATAGEPIGAQVARYNTVLAAQAVPEWRTTLDALRELGVDGPVGYWGVSLGAVIGVRSVSAEPRITAAVLGLVGHESLAEAAGRPRGRPRVRTGVRGTLLRPAPPPSRRLGVMPVTRTGWAGTGDARPPDAARPRPSGGGPRPALPAKPRSG
jgi:dienelactone hydrolase